MPIEVLDPIWSALKMKGCYGPGLILTTNEKVLVQNGQRLRLTAEQVAQDIIDYRRSVKTRIAARQAA